MCAAARLRCVGAPVLRQVQRGVAAGEHVVVAPCVPHYTQSTAPDTIFLSDLRKFPKLPQPPPLECGGAMESMYVIILSARHTRRAHLSTAVSFVRTAVHHTLPAPSGANMKPFQRGALMQLLAPRRNPERSNGHLNTLDQDPYFTFPREHGAGVLVRTGSVEVRGVGHVEDQAEAADQNPAAIGAVLAVLSAMPKAVSAARGRLRQRGRRVGHQIGRREGRQPLQLWRGVLHDVRLSATHGTVSTAHRLVVPTRDKPGARARGGGGRTPACRPRRQPGPRRSWRHRASPGHGRGAAVSPRPGSGGGHGWGAPQQRQQRRHNPLISAMLLKMITPPGSGAGRRAGRRAKNRIAPAGALTAQPKAVRPSASTRSAAAPPASSSSTACTWSLIAAPISGVCPPCASCAVPGVKRSASTWAPMGRGCWVAAGLCTSLAMSIVALPSPSSSAAVSSWGRAAVSREHQVARALRRGGGAAEVGAVQAAHVPADRGPVQGGLAARVLPVGRRPAGQRGPDGGQVAVHRRLDQLHPLGPRRARGPRVLGCTRVQAGGGGGGRVW